MNKRAYDNRKRETKRQANKDKIVEIMATLLAKGEDDIPVSELAKLAGVSLRSVYLHFPDKQARIQAISDWIDTNVQASVVLPQNFADIPHYIETRIDYMLDNETLVRAQMASGVSKEVRSFRKLVHAKHLRLVLSEQLTSEREIDELVAVIVSLVRAEAILDLRYIYKMSRKRIKQHLAKLITLTIENAQSNPKNPNP